MGVVGHRPTALGKFPHEAVRQTLLLTVFVMTEGFSIGGNRNQLGRTEIPPNGQAQPTGKDLGTIEQIVEPHIPRNRSVVEKDIDIGFRIAFKVTAIGTSGIDLSAPHFVPLGMGIVVGGHGAAAFHLGGSENNKLNPFAH